MANIKVSEMPETTAANIDDLIMIIQGGGNKKITEKNLLGDRVVVSPTEPTGNNRKKIWFQKGKNLFNKNNIQSGSELLSTTLYAQPNSDYYISDYIEITPGQTYYLSGNKTGGTTNIFYNENKVPMSSYAATTGTIPIPDSATYIRFNGRLNELDNNIQLEQGSKATTYEAYIRPTIYILNDNNVYEKIIETIDENDFYSVGEQKTNKIWIDGKPMYRRTIKATVKQGTTNTEISIADIPYDTIMINQGKSYNTWTPNTSSALTWYLSSSDYGNVWVNGEKK